MIMGMSLSMIYDRCGKPAMGFRLIPPDGAKAGEIRPAQGDGAVSRFGCAPVGHGHGRTVMRWCRGDPGRDGKVPRCA